MTLPVRTLPAKTLIRRGVALVATGAMTVLLTATGIAPAQGAVPAPPSGWTTVFSDDFNGPSGSGVNTANWMYNTGPGSNFGTGEIETMTNSTSNVHLDGNGDLDITALGSGSNWTSGRVQTTSANVGAPAGGKLEVTASIQQPNPAGLGYWPAFWMLGPGQWPENGEIDIMEDVNALSEVAGTLHCGTYPGGACNEGNGIGSGLRACSGCQSGFHTYSMILDRTNTSNESITLLPRRQPVLHRQRVRRSARRTWQQAYDHNLSIILDLAMGGGFPNGVCNCTSPTGSTASGGTMRVDYVAAYTTSGGGGGNPPPRRAARSLRLPGPVPRRPSSSTANGNPVQIYTCNGTSAAAVDLRAGRHHAARVGQVHGRGQRRHGQRNARSSCTTATTRAPRCGYLGPTARCTTRSRTGAWTTRAGRRHPAPRWRSGTAPATPTRPGTFRNQLTGGR